MLNDENAFTLPRTIVCPKVNYGSSEGWANAARYNLTNVEIIADKATSRRWEHELLARLRAAGHAVSVRLVDVEPAPISGFDRLLGLEARRSGPSLADRSAPLQALDAGQAEIIVDLVGVERSLLAGQVRPVLTLALASKWRFPEGIMPLLAGGGTAELVTRLDGVPVGRARPMLGDRLWLGRACNDLLAAAISLIEQNIGRFGAGRLEPIQQSSLCSKQASAKATGYLAFMARGLAGRVLQRLLPRSRRAYWQVAYRQPDGTGIADSLCLDGQPFVVLPDDGQRFYADPFVFERDGRQYLFVEEFPYATGKGVIAVAEMDVDGRFGPARTVLAVPHHLSYPQVFGHDGEIYMIPESSSALELVLYRAEAFPDRWVRDTVLLAGRHFNDATLLERDGRFWLFGTERYGQGSPSDSMAVYSAPALRGPWTPHPLNPIQIDHAATRPGGAFVQRGERLFLPVQDGSRAYGGGLGLMELLRLDAEGVTFAPPQPIVAGPAWARAGIHTLNRVGQLEVVDSAG